MGYIERYNRAQWIGGVLNIALGLFLLWIMWWFFELVLGFVLHGFWRGTATPPWAAAGITAVAFASGVWQWSRSGASYRVFTDTPLYYGLEPQSGGGAMMQLYVNRVTGIAYLLSQIFLASPWQICTGVARLRSRLPNDPELEQRMHVLLERMRAEGKWESATKYLAEAEELGALIRCGLMEFSVTKMRVKAVK